MDAVLTALGCFILVSVVLGDDQYPKFDFQKCYSRKKLMNVSSEADGCEWIKKVDIADYERYEPRISDCYRNRYKFILPDYSYDVKKCLEAYDGIAVDEKKQSIFDAFNKCNKEVGGGVVIKVEQQKEFRFCYRTELSKLCPVDKYSDNEKKIGTILQ